MSDIAVSDSELGGVTPDDGSGLPALEVVVGFPEGEAGAAELGRALLLVVAVSDTAVSACEHPDSTMIMTAAVAAAVLYRRAVPR